MSQPDWIGKAEICQHTIAVISLYPCMVCYIVCAVIIAVLITLWKDLEM